MSTEERTTQDVLLGLSSVPLTGHLAEGLKKVVEFRFDPVSQIDAVFCNPKPNLREITVGLRSQFVGGHYDSLRLASHAALRFTISSRDSSAVKS